jgi:type II secretory ATPase GspE/PulE/Tfp pilus assembly ATPase PilB-like protein
VVQIGSCFGFGQNEQRLIAQRKRVRQSGGPEGLSGQRSNRNGTVSEIRIQLPSLARNLAEALENRSEGDEGVTTVRLIIALINDAVRERASDIHLDPLPDGCWVRFRIDGTMVDAVRLPKDHARRLVRAIKTHAGMNPACNPIPADGRCEFPSGERKIPVRVATAPCVSGEKVAIRFLPTRFIDLNVKQLGLGAADLAEILRAIEETSGMFLISGPTGSGKTTTAYALLRYLMESPRSIAH